MTIPLVLTVVAIALALLGRSASPPAERLPIHHWGLADLVANLVAGLRELHRLNRRQIEMWEHVLGQLQPHSHKKSPGHSPGMTHTDDE